MELVRRGLASSRAQAQELVAAGGVTVRGAPTDKPSRQVGDDEPIEILSRPRFVSRGGLKLDAALDAFGVDVTELRAIDVGSSTGGFTDCLIQRGAREVVAIDVGRHQLHERLRADAKVVVHEQTSVRGLDPASVGGPAPFVCTDVSFISLRLILPDLVALADDGANLVLLVKPQFEAGRAEADKGRGVIRDPTIHARVLAEVVESAASAGAVMLGLDRSPLVGADGNVEFLLHLGVPLESRGCAGEAPPPTTVDDEHVTAAIRRVTEPGEVGEIDGTQAGSLEAT